MPSLAVHCKTFILIACSAALILNSTQVANAPLVSACTQCEVTATHAFV